MNMFFDAEKEELFQFLIGRLVTQEAAKKWKGEYKVSIPHR
jgi:hypothetical protein